MRAKFGDRKCLHHPTVIRSSSKRPKIFYIIRKTDAPAGILLDQSAAEAQQAWRISADTSDARRRPVWRLPFGHRESFARVHVRRYRVGATTRLP